MARPLLLNPPEKKLKKFRGCSLGCTTRFRAGFFGSAAAVFSVVFAVASGVAAAVGASGAAGAPAGAKSTAGTTAAVAAGDGAAAAAGAAVGATAGAAAGATFAAAFPGAFGAAGAAAMAVDAGRLAATGDGVTASARAANAAAEYCRTGAGGGWFLASEGSTNEWKATAQTAYTPRHPPTVSRTDGRRCCRVDKDTEPPNAPKLDFPPISRWDGQTGSIHAGKFDMLPTHECMPWGAS